MNAIPSISQNRLMTSIPTSESNVLDSANSNGRDNDNSNTIVIITA